MKAKFSTKKIIHGAATVLNIWPSRDDHRKAYPHASDTDALRSDWEKIGKDIQRATGKAIAHK